MAGRMVALSTALVMMLWRPRLMDAKDMGLGRHYSTMRRLRGGGFDERQREMLESMTGLKSYRGKMTNIGGDPNDDNYRYKMPTVTVRQDQRTRGAKTTISNLHLIAKSLGRPLSALEKYLGLEFHCSVLTREEEEVTTIRGYIPIEDLQRKISTGFVPRFVLCRSCQLPETRISAKGTGKRAKLVYTCRACGETYEDSMNHRVASLLLSDLLKASSHAESSGKKSRRKGTVPTAAPIHAPQPTNQNTIKDYEAANTTEMQDVEFGPTPAPTLQFSPIKTSNDIQERMMYLKQLQDENLRVKYSNANLTLEAEKLSGLAEVSEQELLEDMDQQLSGPTHEIERLQREISELNLDEEYKDVIDQLWCTEDDIETETDAPSDEITYNMERGLEYIRENPVNETNMNLFLKGKPHEPLTREDKVEQSRADTLKEWVNPRWGEEKGKPLWEAIPFLDSDDGLEEEMDYYHPDSPAPSVGERVLMYSSSRRGWLNATVIQLIGREDDLWIEIEYESKSKSRKRVRQEELRKILC